jgi:hypothetical protein
LPIKPPRILSDSSAAMAATSTLLIAFFMREVS